MEHIHSIDVCRPWITKWTNLISYFKLDGDVIKLTPIGIYPLLFVTQIFHKDRFIDWLVIAYRPERSISAIFRTRTSSMIYGRLLLVEQDFITSEPGFISRFFFCGVCVVQSAIFCLVFCRSLFVFLYFFF
jgi:hypothetical protein